MVTLTYNPCTMSGTAILTCRPNSHSFQERKLVLENHGVNSAVKIGRSVARNKAGPNNAIFDCKVLSRNHALLWYTNGKFYLQDTKSSNGTYVNNQRLSKTNEESAPHELCSGDIVQFGVDVIETNRNVPVTHGCIIANLKLYLPDGKEAKASCCSNNLISSMPLEELYQLNSCIQEALQRENQLKTKLSKLQVIIIDLKKATDLSWKALIQEDRLLSRVEFLESQLASYSKSFTDDKLRDEVKLLHKDKATYENHLKEVMKQMLAEKVEVLQKCQDTERKLTNAENECSNLQELLDKNRTELDELLIKYQDQVNQNKELENVNKELFENNQEKISTLTKLQYETLQAQRKVDVFSFRQHYMQDKFKNYHASFCIIKDKINSVRSELDQETNLDYSVLVKYFDNIQQLMSKFDQYFVRFNLESDPDDLGINSIKDVEKMTNELLEQLQTCKEENESLQTRVNRNEEKKVFLEQSKFLHLDRIANLELKLQKLKQNFNSSDFNNDKLKSYNCDTINEDKDKTIENENDIMCQINEVNHHQLNSEKDYNAINREIEETSSTIDEINIEIAKCNEELLEINNLMSKNEKWGLNLQEQILMLGKTKASMLNMKNIEPEPNVVADYVNKCLQDQLDEAKEQINDYKVQRDSLVSEIENLREKLKSSDRLETELDSYKKDCEKLRDLISNYEKNTVSSLIESFDKNQSELVNLNEYANFSSTTLTMENHSNDSSETELTASNDELPIVDEQSLTSQVKEDKSTECSVSENINEVIENEVIVPALCSIDVQTESVSNNDDDTDDSSSDITDSSTLIRIKNNKPKPNVPLLKNVEITSTETQTIDEDLLVCNIESHRHCQDRLLYKIQDYLDNFHELSPMVLLGIIVMFVLVLTSIVHTFENFISHITATYDATL